MQYPYTAQCPSCRAELDLTQADMEKAQGNVICGNCNHSFYSPDHLLKGFYTSGKGNSMPLINASAKAAPNSPSSAENDATDIDMFLPSSSKYRANRRRKLILRFFLWTTNGLLFFFLLLQLLWLKFDEWVVKEDLRPIYSFLCSIDSLQCTLPAWIEPGSLVLKDFAVTFKDNSVYEMRAQLVNEDNSQHAFPWVDVIFSDINGIAIASGRFSPYQYLLPEETDSLMRTGGTYDILLEVRKPNHPVISYEMRLVAVAP